MIITPTDSGLTTDSKTIKLIKRDGLTSKIHLRSEQTNKEYDFTSTGTELSYNTSVMSFIEGENFQVTVYDSENKVLFKGKLFVTIQRDTIDDNNGTYSINKGKYNSPVSSDDDFIVL